MNEVILKNPITDRIKDAVNVSRNRLNFAVPFLSSFALSVLNEENTKHIADKRLLTRFDDRSITSFDVPALSKLRELGFEIYYDNTIHLKLYITDNETFVTSSNLTQGGFKDNVELTIKIDSENSRECDKIFNELWQNPNNIEVTPELLEASWSKYHFLKKRDELLKKKKRSEVSIDTINNEIDIKKVIDEIFNLKDDYTNVLNFTLEADHVKKQFKEKLNKGFDKKLFYVHEGHLNRRDNLFYDFTYGHEAHIASTGLRELQFRTAFEHDQFKNVIEFILPETIKMDPWDLEDKDELYAFCCGIFEFKIPQYTEALPIRLASYFYPDYFLPIFKLDHLKKICEALDIETDAKSKGEKLYAYSIHIADKMKHLEENNNIKSNIAYNVIYTVELRNRLMNGESYDDIYTDYRQQWKKRYIANGLKVLQKLDFIK